MTRTHAFQACAIRATLAAALITALGNATTADAQNIAGPARGQPRTADPAARGVPLSEFPRFVKLADNVYGYEEIRQPGFTTVSLVVVGRDGVLIADGQGSPAATQTMLDRIRTITTLPIKWYIVGSDHGDHTAGNTVLPGGITYVVHRNSLAQLKRDAAAAAAAGRAAVIVPPRAMTGDDETIDVGTTRVVVKFLGRAHTGGDIMVHLPREQILFMSEAYLNRVFPAMRSAYPSEWVEVTNKALAMRDVRHYIPGHGFIETPDVSREELVRFRDAIIQVNAEAKRLKGLGIPMEDAVKQAQWGELSTWFLAGQQAPVAIRKVWEELDGKLAK